MSVVPWSVPPNPAAWQDSVVPAPTPADLVDITDIYSTRPVFVVDLGCETAAGASEEPRAMQTQSPKCLKKEVGLSR